MKRFAAALAMTFTTALAAACLPAAEDGVTVLTYASPYSPGHPFSRADIVWMEHVEAASQGRIRIRPYWSGGLLSSDHSMIEVRHGLVDVGLITPIYTRGGAHVLRVQAGFYGGVETYAHQLAVYDCIANAFPYFARETTGLKVLAVQGGNFPGVVTRSRPVRTLADFAGLRLRAPTELTPVLQALGADPVNMPMGDVYSALAKGVIDGVVAPADTLQSLHFHEVARHFSRVQFARGAYPSRAMSQATWDTLNADEQAILEEASRVWTDSMMDEITRAEARGAAFGADNGIEFNDFDAADQIELNALYNRIAEEAAEKLKRDGVDGTPILARAQAVIAALNAGEQDACAATRTAGDR